MNTNINSKHGTVPRSPADLYMQFTDMRNFSQFVPEDMKMEVTADFDNLHLVVQGFNIGIRVTERQPYSKISYSDNDAPFKFNVSLNFDTVASDSGKTDFYINVEAELNLMMKMMLKSRIQEALDKIVDSLSGAKA